MAIRRRSRYSKLPLDIAPIVHLWLLRLLVPLGGQREFISQHGFNNDTLAELIGLGEWIDPAPQDFDPRKVRTELRKIHQAGELKLCDAEAPACLQGNVERLSELVGLSETDCRILEFAVLIQNERLLDDTADWLGQLSSMKVFHALSVLLNLPEQDIRVSLSAQGILARSGLVSVDRNGSSLLRGKLDLLSDNFADHIFSSEADPISLLRDTVAIGSPAELEISDYAHIAPSLLTVSSFRRNLASTVSQRCQ